MAIYTMGEKPQRTAVDPALVGSVEELRAHGAWIDYESFLPPPEHRTMRDTVVLLQHELPFAWTDRYVSTMTHPANLLRVDANGFEYLVDEPAELTQIERLYRARTPV